MYNDYYLAEISSKMSTNNGLLDEIIDNQESIINNQATIIVNQEEIISGDRELRILLGQNINVTMILALIVCLLFIYNFIVRCLK